jgi:hypothetical protein
MSSGLILKMNNGYNRGQQSAREVCLVEGRESCASCPKGRGALIDREAVG